jgi:uncharacterized protein YoxC
MVHAVLRLPQGAADTVIARIVLPEPSWFEQVIGVASGILTLLPFVLLVVAIWVALKVRDSFERARESLTEVRADIRELIGAANRISEDLAGVSQSVRSSVDTLNETVTYTNTRARHAVSRLADRVDAFNDALEVVQEDTQSVIVTALSALRGLRAGVAAMRKPTKRRRRRDVADELAVDEDDPEDYPRPSLRRRARGGD